MLKEKVLNMKDFVKVGNGSKKEKMIRQAKMVSKIIGASTVATLEDPTVSMAAITVTLATSTTYNRSVKDGLKNGIATIGAMGVINGVVNLAKNIDIIKNA